MPIAALLLLVGLSMPQLPNSSPVIRVQDSGSVCHARCTRQCTDQRGYLNYGCFEGCLERCLDQYRD